MRQRKYKGQNIVEFAFVSLILFTVITGILEMGRFLFIFSQVSSAAQEGSRYGSTHPRSVIDQAEDGGGSYHAGAVPVGAHNPSPCNIVTQARRRVVMVPTNPSDPDRMQVYVSWDNGNPGTLKDPWGGAGLQPFQDRVVVTAVYRFHFMIGLFDRFTPGGLPIQMVSSRTVMADETNAPADCDYNPSTAPTNTPAPTNTRPPSSTPVPAPTNTSVAGPTNTRVPSATPIPVPTNTPGGPSPTRTPIPPSPTRTATPCVPQLTVTLIRAQRKQNGNASSHTASVAVTIRNQYGALVTSGITVQYYLNGALQGNLTYSAAISGWTNNCGGLNTLATGATYQVTAGGPCNTITFPASPGTLTDVNNCTSP